MEHHGRLARSDGREVAAGQFDLQFRLHLRSEGAAAIWEETHRAVSVRAGGHYSVLLGEAQSFDESSFDEPRWLGVYVCRDGSGVEVGHRVQLTGASVRLYWALQSLAVRVAAAEVVTAGRFTSRENVDPEARTRILQVHRRLKRVEQAAIGVARVGGAVAELQVRVRLLDDEDRGRVVLLEDEVRDIVGPDGDILDLIERVEALERGHGGPMWLAGDTQLATRLAAVELQNTLLQRNVDALSRALELVANQLSAPPPTATPEVFPGPLTVQRGGLHVAGGGLVVHDIEGRIAGASKRDGPLLVNARSGADLVVGNKVEGSVAVTASLRAGRAAGVQRAVALRMGGEALGYGDVVVAESGRKGVTVRRALPGEVPFGVVVERAAVELGAGPILVAVSGLVKVRVAEPVGAGVVLVAGADGAALPGTGPGIGRTVGPSAGGFAEILVHGP